MKRFVVLTKTWIRSKHCARHNGSWYCKLQHVFKVTSFSLDTGLQTFPPLVHHSVRSQPRPSPITASTQPSLVGLLAFCTLVPSCSPEFCSRLGSGPNCPVVTNPVNWCPTFPNARNRLQRVRGELVCWRAIWCAMVLPLLWQQRRWFANGTNISARNALTNE